MPSAGRFETAAIVVGSGTNGKSTLLNTLADMLGPDNVAHVPLDGLHDRFRLIELKDKHANIVSDVSHMNRMDRVAEGVLKQLISGDPISSDRKHQGCDLASYQLNLSLRHQ